MSSYQIVTQPGDHLRHNVQNILTTDPTVLDERIFALSTAARQLGQPVTFGAEIEYQFVPNPGSAFKNTKTSDDLHEEVFNAIQGSHCGPPMSKGEIFHPAGYRWPLISSHKRGGHYNHDQFGSEINEVQTSPTDALDAIDRYWQVIETIGEVATRFGQLGMILSTHISGVAWQKGVVQEVPFDCYEDDGKIVGNIQRNLNALYPLRLNAGLETGIAVQEAFPAKQASTAIHYNRLEIRQPIISVSDPRLDIIGVLEGVYRATIGEVSEQTLSQFKEGRAFRSPYHSRQIPFLERLAVITQHRGKNILRLPASIDSDSLNDSLSNDIDKFLRDATGQERVSYKRDQGTLLRHIIKSLEVKDDGSILVKPTSPFRQQLEPLFDGVTASRGSARTFYEPVAFFDSPKLHQERRGRVTRSSIVRRILGEASATLTSGPEAIAQRKALIARQGVVLRS